MSCTTVPWLLPPSPAAPTLPTPRPCSPPASPPRVVAYALAGRLELDLYHEPLGQDSRGQPVYLRDIWPSQQEVQRAIEKSVRSEMFHKEYGAVFKGDDRWNSLKIPEGDLF